MRKVVGLFLAVLLLAGLSFAADSNAAFEKMKTLVGRWEAALPDGQKSTDIYEVVSGGTALMNRSLEPGHNMVTMIHPDGAQLMLTHYCAANNQPRMRATAYDPATRKLAFEFVDATNMPDANAGHMHSVIYHFVDNDHFNAEWTFYKDGKATSTETFKFQRVKEKKP